MWVFKIYIRSLIKVLCTSEYHVNTIVHSLLVVVSDIIKHCYVVFFQSIEPVVGQSSPAVMDAVCLSSGCVMASMTVGILVMRMDVVRFTPPLSYRYATHSISKAYGKLVNPKCSYFQTQVSETVTLANGPVQALQCVFP